MPDGMCTDTTAQAATGNIHGPIAARRRLCRQLPMFITMHPIFCSSWPPRVASRLVNPMPQISTSMVVCGVLTVAMLSGCASTPLPPWPGGGPAPVQGRVASAPLPRPQTGAVVPAPLGLPLPQGVATAPIEPQAPLVGYTEAPTVPPYGPEVAARFPAPGTVYNTPGLAAERRAFTTNAELANWMRSLADTAPSGATRTQLLDVGRSQRGEPVWGLVLTRAAGTSPGQLDASQRPTVLLIGQQHGNEPAGSEALLVIARELSQGLLAPLLDRINVVVVPRANPDGAASNSRTTANGVDMNRDHLVLSTPEALALARLVNDFRPLVVVDAHEYTAVGRYLEKFNAIQRYDALLQYTTTGNYPEFLTKASQEWFYQPIEAALKTQGLTSEMYFTTNNDPENKRISMGGTQPDTSRNVNGLKNTVSLLIETRGVGIGRLHLQRRVHTHVTAISSALRSTAERATNLEQVRSFVTRDVSAKACRDQMVVQAQATPTQRTVVFLDPATGADRPIRVEWNSSLDLRTVKSRVRPCGYWIAATETTAIERLKQLGVQVMRVAESGSALAETYRETERTAAPRQDVLGSIPGTNDTVQVEVSLQRSAIDTPAGSFYVPLNQPRANVAIAALEPDTQNSYFANRVIETLRSTARIMSPPAVVFEETE